MGATNHAALVKRIKRGDALRKWGLALSISAIPAFGLAITFIENTLVGVCLLLYAPTAVLLGFFVKGSGDDMRRYALKELGAHGRVVARLPVARVIERDNAS
jgi:hypothetical protein